MKIVLFSIEKKRLLATNEIWDIIKLKDNRCFHLTSFLSKSYWKKRGLYLLLKHKSIVYERLPLQFEGIKAPTITNNNSLMKCLNPILIAEALLNEHPEWLPFYIKYEFEITILEKQNPFLQKELLEKIIINKFAILNHSSKYDISTRYLMPLKNILISLKRFPDKLEKSKPIIEKLHVDFFYSYEVVQLIFLIEGYVSQFNNEKDTFTVKLKIFYTYLIDSKAIAVEYFDNELINYNLQTLDKLYANYISVKYE